MSGPWAPGVLGNPFLQEFLQSRHKWMSFDQSEVTLGERGPEKKSRPKKRKRGQADAEVWIDDMFAEGVDPTIRDELFARLMNEGDEISSKYSWAVPSEAALTELANHQPLIEVGAGKG
eukprot:c55496_g1_i1.p1 GENE.c55496_g1_i1~~c55496_g1_i1.p1  ORF type:complete len:119 (+),score=13.74 c55496_g1_i1:20-376(+)